MTGFRARNGSSDHWTPGTPIEALALFFRAFEEKL
jgi:hypothetical protein